jgi:hypothetical protein
METTQAVYFLIIEFISIIYDVSGSHQQLRMFKASGRYVNTNIILGAQDVRSSLECAHICLKHDCTGTILTPLGPDVFSCELFRDYPMKTGTVVLTSNVYMAGKSM